MNISQDNKVKQNVYMVKISLASNDHVTLDQSAKRIVSVIKEHRINPVGPIPFPVHNVHFATRRAPSIYKVSFEKFVYKVHHRLIIIKNIQSIQELKFIGKVYIPKMVNINIKFVKETK